MNPYTDGACITMDPLIFSPLATDHEGIRRAKVICHGCPVREQCLEIAMSNEFGSKNARDSIYGGTTPSERAQMHKRQQRPINHGTAGGFRTHKRRNDPPCQSCTRAHKVQAAAHRLLAKERAA